MHKQQQQLVAVPLVFPAPSTLHGSDRLLGVVPPVCFVVFDRSPAYQVQPSSGPDSMAVHPLSAPAAGFLSPRAQSRLDDATLGDEPTLTVAEPPPARGYEGGEREGFI